jgi:hypothetical protein
MNDKSDIADAASRLRGDGLWTYLSALYAGSEPVFETIDSLSRHLYWQDKDLDLSARILEAGIHYSLLKASECPVEKQNDVKSWAKTFAYNLGSFCWPGWDEAGIAPTESQIAAGREAAALNLRLAIELNKPAIALARAYWLVGAYELVAADYKGANETFQRSASYADQAGVESECLLAQGYAQIAAALVDPGRPESASALSDIKARLTAREHGEALVEQLDRAGRVFCIER